MPRGTRKLQINRQQKHILLLALFLLKYAHGKPHPLKRHVIGFIDTKNLITIRPEDRKIVATGEEAWENSIAFRRADLKAEGCLTMPDIGVWQITPSGERRLIEWCAVMNEFVAYILIGKSAWIVSKTSSRRRLSSRRTLYWPLRALLVSLRDSLLTRFQRSHRRCEGGSVCERSPYATNGA